MKNRLRKASSRTSTSYHPKLAVFISSLIITPYCFADNERHIDDEVVVTVAAPLQRHEKRALQREQNNTVAQTILDTTRAAIRQQFREQEAVAIEE